MNITHMSIGENGGPKFFVTSDTHFGHANIIKYCTRPFENTWHMQEALIKNWNSVVGPNDTVYHLGDFIFGGKPEEILRRLNGIKILIAGNHDGKKTLRLNIGWAAIVHGEYLIAARDSNIVMRHYNFVQGRNPRDDDRFLDGSHILLHGHSHGQYHHDFTPRQYTLDIGVDCFNYAPIPLQMAIEIALEEPKDRWRSPKNSIPTAYVPEEKKDG